MNEAPLPGSSWVIYKPSEGMYAHRAIEWVPVNGAARESGGRMFGELEKIRALLRISGFAQFDRHPDDDESIVEVWL